MAKLEAEKRGLPPQLPVMASLVESGLKNLNFGDADSRRLLPDARLSYWNQGDYAGYPDDPEKQVDWFLDQAEQIKAQRESPRPIRHRPQASSANGSPTSNAPPSNTAAATSSNSTRPTACSKAAPPPAAPEAAAAAPAPAAQAVAEAAAPPAMAQGPGAKAQAALAEAKKYLGTPYKWGGSTPQTGFDCSGLVQWAYAQQGIQIPRVTDQQILATNGTAVKRSELLAGDLVFFRDATRLRPPRRDVARRRQVHPRAAHRRRGQDLEPRRAVLQGAVHRRPAVRQGGERRAGGAGRAVPVQPAAAGRRPGRGRAGAGGRRRDAAEAGRQGSGLFKAISAQEARNHEEARALASDGSAPRRSDSALFLQAITPERAAEAKAAAQAAPVPPPAPEAAAPARPAAPAAAPAAPEVAAAAPAGPGPDLADVPRRLPRRRRRPGGAREVARQAAPRRRGSRRSCR